MNRYIIIITLTVLANYYLFSQSNLVDANLFKPSISLVIDESDHVIEKDLLTSFQEDINHIKLNSYFVEFDDVKYIQQKEIDISIIKQFKNVDFINKTIINFLTDRQKQLLKNLSQGINTEISEEAWFKNKLNSLYIIVLSLNSLENINNSIFNNKKVLEGYKGDYKASLYKIELSEIDYNNFLINYNKSRIGFTPKINKVATISGIAKGYTIIGQENQLTERLLKKRLLNDAFSKSLEQFSAKDEMFSNKFALDGDSDLYFKKENYNNIIFNDLLDVYQLVQVNDKIIKKRKGSVRAKNISLTNGIVEIQKNELGLYNRGMLLIPKREVGINFELAKSFTSSTAEDFNCVIGYNIINLFKIQNKRLTRLNFKIGITNLTDESNYSLNGTELSSPFKDSRMFYYSAGMTEQISLNQLLKLNYGVFFNSRNNKFLKEKELTDFFKESLPSKYGRSLDLNLYFGVPISFHRSYSIVPYFEYIFLNIMEAKDLRSFTEINKLGINPTYSNKYLFGLKLSIHI